MIRTLRLTLALLVGLTAVLTACRGRDPHANDPATPQEGEGEPEPTVRTLVSCGRLFGTMPIDNRFQDPLLTFTGAGWYTYANDYRSYGNVVREVGPSPTGTAYLLARAEDNARGVTILGQLKTSRAPLHVEMWAGAEGDEGDFGGFELQFAGLFADGAERILSLQGDESSRIVLGGRTWQRFSVEVAEGPVGWSMVLATAPASFALGGPVAVELPAMPNAALVGAAQRPLTDHERLLVQAVRERTRTLALPRLNLRSPAGEGSH